MAHADPPPVETVTLVEDGFYALDSEWRFVEVNAAAEQHFRRNAHELVGKNIWQETGQGPESAVYVAFHQAAERRQIVRLEAESRVQPGEWFELHLHPSGTGRLDVHFHNITARRNAEEQLRLRVAELEAAHRALEQEKRRLEAVLNALPVGVAITDIVGGTIQSNKAFEDVWRGPRPATASVADYAAYKAWWVETGAAVGAHEWASALSVETGATVIGQLLEIERFDGTRAYVSNSAAPVRDADGRVVGSAVAIEDVTAIHRADAAIRESEERYRRLFDHMAEGCFLAEIICDAAGRPVDYRYLAANPALEPLTGLRHDEIIGRTVREVLPGVEHYWIETYGRVALSGRPERIENFAAPLGRYYSTLAYATGPGQFACLFSDVTDRKRAEQALRENEERLRLAIDSTKIGAFDFYPQTGRLMWSEFAKRHFGLSADAEVDYDTFLRGVHPEDRDRVNAVVQGVLRGDGGGQYSTEYRTIGIEDGEQRWLSAQGRAFFDQAGNAVRFIGVTADISERKRTEQALRLRERELSEAFERLADADRRKDEFIAILSHELRNPLAPIRYALPLLAQERGSEPAARALAVVERQVSHLARLVDDLLDVSRITSGKIELRCEHVALNGVITAAVEAASPWVAAGRHSLDLDLPKEPMWLNADGARIAQVITNLLSNSAKYTPEGGRILLTTSPMDGQVVIRVADTGIGLAPDAIPAVFDMFSQVAGDRSKGGLGIGLSLAKWLVEMHGGTITAESAGPNQGATFTVRLPLAESPATSQRSPVRLPGAAPTPLRVLVVDDNVDLVEMLTLVVETAGHDVRKAYDGRTAISAALDYQPHVVLLDVGMPDMSGLEVTRELRRHPAMSEVRIVALTGWGQVEDRRRTADAGFDDHVTKPAEPERIQQILDEVALRVRS